MVRVAPKHLDVVRCGRALCAPIVCGENGCAVLECGSDGACIVTQLCKEEGEACGSDVDCCSHSCINGLCAAVQP